MNYDVVVLAGGRSRRMRVADKTALTLGGVSLLDRVLAPTTDATIVVVVGSERPVARDVTWVLEDPPGGGPAAAVAAGLATVTADVVVLLAGDLPLLTTGHVDRLVETMPGDGAVYVDEDGAEQWLCSAWRTSALRSLVLTAGSSLRHSLAPLTFARLTDAAVAVDCDAPDDLRRAEELLT